MRKSTVLGKLRRNEPVSIICLHMTDPSVHELASLMGIDGIWMDMEHHSYTLETASHMMRAARVGTADVLARPARGEFMRMARMLEAGATGILYPRCGSAEEAAEVVQNAKFPPLGIRGADGGNPDMPYCTMDTAEYIKMANEETFVLVQLEDEAAVAQADAIAAVEGVDGLVLGPGDFTIQSGIPGQFTHPKVESALDTIAAAAARHGKHWGMPAKDPERLRNLMDRGARLMLSGSDIGWIRDGLLELQESWSKLGITFNNQLDGFNNSCSAPAD